MGGENWEETQSWSSGLSEGVFSRVVPQDQDQSVSCEELASGPKEGAERGLAFVPSGGTDQGTHRAHLCSG